MRNVNPNHAAPEVCLDAGHYGKYNRSPSVPEYYESDMTWALHNHLARELTARGIRVTTTRTNQGMDLDLTKRGKTAAGSDLFLSLHSNAAAEGRELVDYPVVYHLQEDDGTDADEKSKALAEILAPVIAKVMGTTQPGQVKSRKASSDKNGDGVLNDNYYGVLNGARQVNVPGLILEHSFHTNPDMARWLLDDANLQHLARAEADAIADWFDLAREPEHWYRIRQAWDKPETQLGAYLDLEGAKRSCPDGYTVFDWNGNAVYPEAEQYTLAEFVRDVQAACGAAVDGEAGPETLSKTVTISAGYNRTHGAVKAVQARLAALGYEEVGTADGTAGPKFTSALAHYQLDHGCTPTGLAEAWGQTWQHLLGMV